LPSLTAYSCVHSKQRFCDLRSAFSAHLLHLLDVVTAPDRVSEVCAETPDFLFLLQLLLFAVVLLPRFLGEYDGEERNRYDKELHSAGVWLLRLSLV
jgi:hypothetical protein